MLNIRQNLFLAFIYNTLSIPIAAGVLYPFFGLFLSPMIAAAVMSLSSVSIIVNALRLQNMDLQTQRPNEEPETYPPQYLPPPKNPPQTGRELRSHTV